MIPAFVAIGDGVLFQKIQNEIVLLNMENQQYYGLNESASELWESLIELGSVSAVEDKLSASFDADPRSVSEDLRNLVSEMLAAGLLKPLTP